MIPSKIFAIAFFAGLLMRSGITFSEDVGKDESEKKLAIHGFLTQAYTISNGNQVIGITEDGTLDYRTAALQFRYSATDNDHFVLQVDHERTGRSPLFNASEDVELDWAFYEHRFSDGTSVKAGRVQIPIGIFNEVRDVGTILPFYRPDSNFYGANSFTNETLDGVVVSRRFNAIGDWSADLSLYYGGWDYFEIYDGTVVKAKIRNGAGFQVWLNTPVQGLRLGYHYSHQIAKGGLRPVGETKETFDISYLSVDGSFDRFFTRWEGRYQIIDAGHYFANYVQAGVFLTKKVSVAFQRDEARLYVNIPNFVTFEDQVDVDYAASLRYFIFPNLVVKAEVHKNKSRLVEEPITNIFFDKPRNTTYGILSISANF